MANDKKFVTKNGLQTQNASLISPDKTNTITISMLDSDTLSFSGDAGQLFSITDSLTGTIFAVNDISGIPSIEVDSDGTVRFAEFDGNVLIGTATDNAIDKVQINGNILVSSNIIVGAGVLATTATDGFMYSASMAGLPTGVPTTNTGRSPFTYDTTNDKLYFYNGSGGSPFSGWQEIGGATTLDGLTDVTITAIASGEVLKWNGSAWINNTLAEAGISATGHTHTGVYEPADATILKDADIGVTVQAYDATILVDADIGVNVQAYDATYVADADIGVTVQAYDATILVDADIGVNVAAFAHTHNINSLTDVSVTALAAGEVLVSAGSPLGWVNNTLAEAGISATGHNHDATYVNVTGDTMSGDLHFGDVDIIYLGTDDDLLLYHSGTNAIFKNTTGTMFFQQFVNSDLIYLTAKDSGGTERNCIVAGGATPDVKLYYNGIQALATTAGGGIDVPGDGLFGANNATGAITVQSGDDSVATNNRTQIRFGFNDSTNYPHFITTRHNAATSAGNAIEFYTGDGTAGGVYPTNAVLNLTLEAGDATFAGDVTITGTMNASAVDINGLTADATPIGSTDYVMTYDDSAGANKKVLIDNLPGGGASTLVGLTDVTYVGSPAPLTGQVLTYDGSVWNNETPAGGEGSTLFEYTATASQTTFTGADDNANSLLYTVDKLLVILNGVVLDGADFTATNGVSIVLGTGADVGSSLNILAFGSITISNTYTKAETDDLAIAYAIALG